jgi:LTXXQ motif family protein
MRAYCCKVLLCATALILVSPAADARYWRYYGYHWYGRSWNGSPSTSDERQVEKRPLGTEPGNDPRQVGDFGAAIEQMNHACDRQVAELKDMPLDAVARVVDPTPDQRDALDHIRSVALDASESLAAVCPKNASASIHERLETLSRTLDAMAVSLATLRPAFATFYGLLNDEQKARLVAMTPSRDAQSQSEEASRSRQSQDVAQRRDSSGGDLYCQQWVTYLKRWPIRQIEDRGHLSDDQRANLYDLTAAIYREAGRLGRVCHADDRFTPPGRLDARQQQLKALAQSVDAISPVFSRFEDELTDPQKAQLRGTLNLSNTNGQRSVRQ